MNASNEPWRLHMALQLIIKVHGLTPHSATDRCPYELIKSAPLPSLFPRLTADVSKNLELTATKQCAAKLRNRREFNEGDNVVVYDNFRKISYPAVVSEILGTNNYLVNSDNGSKHVSGDNMSMIPKVREEKTADGIDRNNIENEVVDEDNESVTSELSDDFDELPPNNMHIANNNLQNLNNNLNQPRRGQRELINLGQVPRLPRLRSGRV